MRDIALTLIVFGSLPVILKKPWVGLLMWTWLSLMSPQRLTWGFAFSLPFSQAVAIATLLSVLISREPKRIPWSGITFIWACFVVWMCFTTTLALDPSEAYLEWDRMIKIQLFCFLTLMFGQQRDRLNAFVWVVAFSLGFYGIKGGVFTIATGGSYLVWGPAESFVEGNNELAFALIVILPLMRFLQMHSTDRRVVWAFSFSMLFCVASIVGSHSRGAFLALLAMGTFLFWKSRRRMLMIPAFVLIIPIGLAFMPQEYWDRMSTISSYEQDASAMGRINAWTFAWNLAADRPLTGGGFRTFTPGLFKIYAPNPDDFHDVHSIYFEVLGEHGWPGFLMYMTLAILAYFSAGRTDRLARGDPDLLWHADLARMSQVCMVGYAVGGAFLGLAYFDLYYDIVAIIVLNRLILERRLAERSRSKSEEHVSNGLRPANSGRPVYGRLPESGTRASS